MIRTQRRILIHRDKVPLKPLAVVQNLNGIIRPVPGTVLHHVLGQYVVELIYLIPFRRGLDVLVVLGLHEICRNLAFILFLKL